MKYPGHKIAALLLALTAWLATPAANAEPCPSPGGDPCKADGPAAKSTGTPTGALNPIDFVTGAKYNREADLPALPGPLGLELVRHYNYPSAYHGRAGANWSFSYEAFAYVSPAVVQIYQGDGKRREFEFDAKAGVYTNPNPLLGQVSIEKTSDGLTFYRWQWPEGRALVFEKVEAKAARLTRIEEASGEALRLAYGADGRLDWVSDPRGRKLEFVYAPRRAGVPLHVTAVDTPVGRFRFDHDEQGRLTRATSPQGQVREYHYEPARQNGHRLALTGISSAFSGKDGQAEAKSRVRVATYAYDAKGRAQSSERGEGVERGTVEYVRPAQAYAPADTTGKSEGLTVLTNSLGAKTTYRTAIVAGDYAVVGVEGAGCASCGETDVRYRYHPETGLLQSKIKLSEKGVPIGAIHFQYDNMHRLVRLEKQGYDQSGRPSGPRTLVERREYPNVADVRSLAASAARVTEQELSNFEASKREQPSAQADAKVAAAVARAAAYLPTLIARPSVIPGKERVMRVRYGTTVRTRLKPMLVTDEGYTPTDMESSERFASIRRTVAYRYNAWGEPMSVQMGSGEPTHIEYDNLGRVQAIQVPQGPTTRVLARDEIGRPALMQATDGKRIIETHVRYVPHGETARVEQRAWILNQGKADLSTYLSSVVQFDYDQLGRLTSVLHPDGTALSIERDGIGRPVGLKDPMGNRLQTRFDTEGRPLAVVMQDSRGQLLNAVLNLWDERGLLRASLSPSGISQINAVQESEGEQRVVQLDGVGALTAMASTGGAAEMLAPDGGARRLFQSHAGAALIDAAGRAQAIARDDFGRTVVEVEPDAGRTVYRYGDRFTEKRQTALDDKTVVVERLEFDPVGRLIARVRGACTERLAYEGELLAQIKGCGNQHSYARDAFGRVLAQVQSVSYKADASAQPVEVSFKQTYRYDTRTGQVVERTLPDGQTLRYRYDARTQQVREVVRDLAWLSSLKTASSWIAQLAHRVLPSTWSEESVLADVAYRPFGGITGYTVAGVRSETVFDTSGRVSKLSVSAGKKPLEAVVYQYDAVGNPVQIERNGLKRDYRYDSMRRLVSESNSQPVTPVSQSTVKNNEATSAYAYTPLGNRKVAQATGVIPVSVSSDAANIRDGFGRQVKRGAQSFEYDDAHRLVNVSEAGQPVARYTYDALGHRIAKTVKGVTTLFVYDNAHRLIAESDASGRVTTQYLYVDHRPYAVLTASADGQESAVHAVGTDHRGLPLVVTDEKQNVIWQSDFDAFGNGKVLASQNRTVRAGGFAISSAHAADSPAFAMKLRLAGQYADEETGLYYNVFRYYDPAEGRYLTPDPLGTPDGDNRYVYVSGNPLKGIDPKGLFEIPYSFASSTKNFFGSPNAYLNGVAPDDDHGHGNIVHIAFAQYQAEAGEMRFSQAIIDQIIKNTYHSDAVNVTHPFPKWVIGDGVEGGGQFNHKNHFDNPNDGPMCKDEDCNELTSGYTVPGGGTPDWIGQSLDQIIANRKKYADVGLGSGSATGSISGILNAFGQNSHALADFYAHSNWVDATDRGGAVSNTYKEDGKEMTECGWVPVGLNKTTVWDENVSGSEWRKLFTGTVQLGGSYDTKNKVCGSVGFVNGKGDIVCEEDKTTHGYWAKDHDEVAPDEKAYTLDEQKTFGRDGLYFWEVLKYMGSPPKWKTEELTALEFSEATYGVHWYADGGKKLAELKSGDRIYVAKPITNRHRMAFYLAIEHTKNEIDALYKAAAGKTVGGFTLTEVFQMDKDELDAIGVGYTDLFSKE